MWSGATPTMVRNGTNQLCLFWAKNHMDTILWNKHEGDGKQLTPVQSMASGFSAACLGPVATGEGVGGGLGQWWLVCFEGQLGLQGPEREGRQAGQAGQAGGEDWVC